MTTRRIFFRNLSGVVIGSSIFSFKDVIAQNITSGNSPVVISTWNHGLAANKAAWEILQSNGYALDAVEAGVKVPEAEIGRASCRERV